MISRRAMCAALAMAPVATAIAGGEHSSAAPAPSTRRFPPLSGREMLRRRYFPNIELTTSLGRKVRFYDDLLKDKIAVPNLMYADCDGICPVTTANLKRVRTLLREQIARDVFIYSLTLRPEQDSPKALRAYAEMHGVNDPNWLLLTGKPEDVDLLRHKLGFADPDPQVDRDKSRHSGMLRYGNEPTCVWGTCQGSAEPEWIAQEIGFAIPRAFKKRPA